MIRTKLIDRILPGYTKGEEIFNMVSHIAGGALGVVALLTCVILAAYNQNVWGIVSGAIYGFTLILLFTASSVYHGLKIGLPKKVFQVIDHCTIFTMIAGTYTPILLNQFREVYPLDAWIMFSMVWGFAILGIVLNAVDLKRFKKFSMICYLGMGWLVVFRFQKLVSVIGIKFFVFLLIGGVCYTIGAILYVAGKKKIYMHSIFHLFVVIAALMHFWGIALFIMSI